MYSVTNALLEWAVLTVFAASMIFGVAQGWERLMDASRPPRARAWGGLVIALAVVLPLGLVLSFAYAWGR